jgi:hypothetical protein
MSRPPSSSSLLTGRMCRPMRFHIVLALERLPAHVTLVRLVVAVALDVLAEVLGLVELGAAQVALVALQQLLVGFLVELQVELALEHRGAEDAGVVPWALGTKVFRIRIGIGSGLDPDWIRMDPDWIRIGSGSDPDSIRSVDSGPDPNSESGSGSRRAKMTHKSRQKIKKFQVFGSAGCSLLKAEGFFCNLGVLYGGLGIGKL